MTDGQKVGWKYPSSQLAGKVSSNLLKADIGQELVSKRLDDLIDRLRGTSTSQQQFLGAFFKRFGIKKKAPVHGLYIYGGVGRGKTMLMDMFYESVVLQKSEEEKIPSIWRLHFHDFMVCAHDAIHEARNLGFKDPIKRATEDLLSRGRVICFDEMEVRDIADAMILSRLFSNMIGCGAIIVTTSNRHVDELYKDGLHRDRFLPFLELLKESCEICHLDNGIDWRGVALSGLPLWYAPSQNNRRKLELVFQKICCKVTANSEVIRVAGREIIIEKVSGDIAFTNFATLCDAPLGARDYLVIAGRFAGLILSDIPQFTEENEHLARRFIWLIDALYDRGRFLIASAETDIDNLYQGHQWKFEFSRTSSRLHEMSQKAGVKESL